MKYSGLFNFGINNFRIFDFSAKLLFLTLHKNNVVVFFVVIHIYYFGWKTSVKDFDAVSILFGSSVVSGQSTVIESTIT